jgi:prolyl oligopeptidase
MTGSTPTTPSNRPWQYPHTERDDVVESWHGVPVPDPYRWLEDPYSERTRNWVAAQNQLSSDYLAGLASRPYFADYLTAALSVPRAGAPRKRAGRYLRHCNDGSQQQDSVYVADDLPGLLAGGWLLVDPAEFAAGGRISIFDISVSPDGRLAAYGLSEAGSDWVQWRVRNIDTGADTGDRLARAKFSTAEWLPDSGGFLYWAYPEQEQPSGADATALGAGRLLWHRLGTAQEQDEVIYYHPEAPRERPYVRVTEDGRWLVLAIHLGTARRNRLAVRRIGDDGQLGPQLDVVAEPRALYAPSGCDGDVLYLRTDDGAARGRLVAVDLAALAAARASGGPEPVWSELLGEQPAVLADVQRAGDGFLAVYLDDAAHRVYRVSLDGSSRVEVPLPGALSVVEQSSHAGDPEAFVGVTSFVDDLRAFRIDLVSGEVTPLPAAAGDEAGSSNSPTVTERGFAISTGDASVPYFVVRRADLPADSPRPTLLFGYGGFNQPMTPAYKAAWPAWVQAGGVLAVANLRGGGEFGREWYEAGTRERKQNVFDDFVAVAQDLVDSGVTTRDQLAVHGRSNGGLLIGAVMTQRPDLAAVALPMVGVLDMLRFHRFTIGWAWISDYGDPEVAEDFAILRAYSPLHNVREGTPYPATLVLTGDHDDRVVPAHSLKFAAALQHAHAGAAPVLARIETATGHGVGKPRSALVAETADMLAFAAEHTGLVPGK